jgi:fatty-acyl-CoA synthase
MPEAIAQKLFDLCGVRYIEGYGMTETISQTHINPPQNPKKQCLGIPAFDTEALVVDPESPKILEPGMQGEIVVRGPQLLTGYWKNEKAYGESWCEVDGKRFFRTGDLGRTDEDGYFYISDRLKRMINAAGMKVWPAEVEAAMYKHPAIKECCIIASPDERKGETVKLVVVLKKEFSHVTGEDILSWSRSQMAAYKIPRKIEFIDALPRTGSGKLMWRALQEKESEIRRHEPDSVHFIGAALVLAGSRHAGQSALRWHNSNPRRGGSRSIFPASWSPRGAAPIPATRSAQHAASADAETTYDVRHAIGPGKTTTKLTPARR